MPEILIRIWQWIRVHWPEHALEIAVHWLVDLILTLPPVMPVVAASLFGLGILHYVVKILTMIWPGGIARSWRRPYRRNQFDPYENVSVAKRTATGYIRTLGWRLVGTDANLVGVVSFTSRVSRAIQGIAILVTASLAILGSATFVSSYDAQIPSGSAILTQDCARSAPVEMPRATVEAGNPGAAQAPLVSSPMSQHTLSERPDCSSNRNSATSSPLMMVIGKIPAVFGISKPSNPDLFVGSIQIFSCALYSLIIYCLDLSIVIRRKVGNLLGGARVLFALLLGFVIGGQLGVAFNRPMLVAKVGDRIQAQEIVQYQKQVTSINDELTKTQTNISTAEESDILKSARAAVKAAEDEISDAQRTPEKMASDIIELRKRQHEQQDLDNLINGLECIRGGEFSGTDWHYPACLHSDHPKISELIKNPDGSAGPLRPTRQPVPEGSQPSTSNPDATCAPNTREATWIVCQINDALPGLRQRSEYLKIEIDQRNRTITSRADPKRIEEARRRLNIAEQQLADQLSSLQPMYEQRSGLVNAIGDLRRKIHDAQARAEISFPELHAMMLDIMFLRYDAGGWTHVVSLWLLMFVMVLIDLSVLILKFIFPAPDYWAGIEAIETAQTDASVRFSERCKTRFSPNTEP